MLGWSDARGFLARSTAQGRVTRQTETSWEEDTAIGTRATSFAGETFGLDLLPVQLDGSISHMHTNLNEDTGGRGWRTARLTASLTSCDANLDGSVACVITEELTKLRSVA